MWFITGDLGVSLLRGRLSKEGIFKCGLGAWERGVVGMSPDGS